MNGAIGFGNVVTKRVGEGCKGRKGRRRRLMLRKGSSMEGGVLGAVAADLPLVRVRNPSESRIVKECT
jgi:hypothetical protein